jgi:hypothetical protein
MNLQIDPHVKAVFDEIVAAAPDIGPTPTSEFSNTDERPQRAWLTVAAAAMLVAGLAAIVGVVVLRSQPSGPAATTATQPSLPAGVPALLEPGANSGLTVTGRSRFAPEQATAGGAVLAPDGTVFGLGLAPTAPLDLGGVLPDNYNERTLAGWPAWGLVDGSAPEEIYRGIEVDCATLSVTTAGEPMWSSDTELLAASVRSDGTTLTIELPDGWTPLGTTTIKETFNSTIAVSVDGADHQVRVRQAIGAPIGALLITMETNPVRLTDDRDVLWHVEGATTPGWNTLVGLRHDTAFSLSGNAPVDVLTQIADSLIAVPADGWLQRPTEPELADETDMAEQVGTLPDCPLQQLDVIDQS